MGAFYVDTYLLHYRCTDRKSNFTSAWISLVHVYIHTIHETHTHTHTHTRAHIHTHTHTHTHLQDEPIF